MAPRNTRNTSSAPTSPLPAQLQSLTPAPLALSPDPEASDGSSGFLYTLFDVLMDVTLKAWIHWHQNGGLFIPSVDAFVRHILAVYFPGMGGWKSFQKQMSNYGLKKRDRNADQAHYVHWDNKFCRGRRDLIPEVQRRPIGKKSTSPSQDTVPEQLVTPNTPAVSEHPGQPNLGDVVEALEKKVAELEGRLEVAEGQISSRLDTALAQFWTILCQMVPIMIWDTIDFAFRALFGLQIPNYTSSTPHHSAGIPVAKVSPMTQGGLTNDPGSSSVPGLGQQSNAGPSIETPTSASNDVVSSSTSQAQVRSNSAGAQTFFPSAPASKSQLQTPPQSLPITSNRPIRFEPATLVPSLPAPKSSGKRASGPTNVGHQ